MLDSSEWMFGDAGGGLLGFHAMAAFNPLRWSGDKPIKATIADLTKLLDTKDKDRPIVLKIPAGVLSAEMRCENVAKAITVLQKPLGVQAEWRYADAGTGVIGFERWAGHNPLRWSDTASIEHTVNALKALPTEAQSKPLMVKVPAGVFTPQRRCENVSEAIALLEKTSRAGTEWKTEYALTVGAVRDATLEQLQFFDNFEGVTQAVDALNHNEKLCEAGACLVFSVRVQEFVLIYRTDMLFRQDELAQKVAGIKNKGSTSGGSSSQTSTKRIGGMRMDMSSLLKAGQASVFGASANCAPKHFDSRNLVILTSGGLDERYDTGMQIGSGAMGIARLLTRKETKQEYVAKESNDGSSEDIVREFEMMRTLRHPNCVKLVEFLKVSSDEQDMVFTICEFANGGDLDKYMHDARKAGGLSLAHQQHCFRDAMTGVAYMHANRCIHNDLKADNMLCMSKFEPDVMPRVVLTDYGLSRSMQELEKEGEVFGDLRYLSPSKWSRCLCAGNTIDSIEECASDDMWAMGVTLFELCSPQGNFPYISKPLPSKDFYDHWKDSNERKCTGCITNERILFDQKCEYCEVIKTLQEGLLGEVLPELPATSDPLTNVLAKLLAHETGKRPTASAVLDDPWMTNHESLASSPVDLAVQPDLACQILLNVVMWRLAYDPDIKRCQDIFECFDKNHQGLVTREEFKQAFQGETQSVDKVFDLADIDGNEMLDFNEFATICFNWDKVDADILKKHIHEVLVDIGNDDGKVDLQQMGVYVGGALDETELTVLFNRMQVESKGHFGAEDVTKFILEQKTKRTTITWKGPSKGQKD